MELVIPSKSDLPGSWSFSGGSDAGVCDVPTKDGWCAEPDGAVKAEVEISFPSKRTAGGGQLHRRGGKRLTRETRR
ncbi:unnamed protein product [Pylaiella littoralis]